MHKIHTSQNKILMNHMSNKKIKKIINDIKRSLSYHLKTNVT